MTYLVVLAFIAILASLGSALYFMMHRGNGVADDKAVYPAGTALLGKPAKVPMQGPDLALMWYDTAKAANLYASHPADLLHYVNAPVGAGAPVPGPLLSVTVSVTS